MIPRIVLQDGPLTLEIDPAIGAAISDFSLTGPSGYRYPILRRAPACEDRPGSMASFIMAPWTNRVAHARFAFQGRQHALRPSSSDGTAIHGDVRSRPFRITDRTPVSVALRLNSADHADINFPFPFTLDARYQLITRTLTTELQLTNSGSHPMPAGLGIHPYFMRTLWDASDRVALKTDAKLRYPTRNQIPSGPPVSDLVTYHLREVHDLSDLVLDDVFAGFSGLAELRWPASGVTLTMTCSPELGHLVVYTPRSPSIAQGMLPWFAVEPVTMVNDGFNALDRGEQSSGVRILAPGESLTARISMRVDVNTPSA